MFDRTQIKQLIQVAEQAWYACAHQTCLIRGCPNEQNNAHQTREQKKRLTFLIEYLMAFKFYQTRPNTIKHDQTRSNSTKQGVQTAKYLVTKQCLMVFGRQTFIVCPGPKTFLLFSCLMGDVLFIWTAACQAYLKRACVPRLLSGLYQYIHTTLFKLRFRVARRS